MSVTLTVWLPGSTVTYVFSATLLVTVTVTVTYPPAGRDPLSGETVTLPAMAAGTLMVYSLTGPPVAVSRKDPLAAFPLADVSRSLPGAVSREPWAGEVDGEGEGGREGEGDADDDVCDGEADGRSVIVGDGGTGLGAPAGIVTNGVTSGVGALAEGAALGACDDAGLTRPGVPEGLWGLGGGVALDDKPTTPAPNPRTEAWGRLAAPVVMITVIPAAAATAAITATTATGR